VSQGDDEIEQAVEDERLVFFSDAVVAIAITLLALELPVPDGDTNRAFLDGLREYRDEYLAFGISFLVIWSHWAGHHRFFRRVRAGGQLVVWNMLWLLMIVVTPFATRVITGEGAFEARFTIYALVQALAGLFFFLMVREVSRLGLTDRPDAGRAVAVGYRRSLILTGVFLLSIPLAFLVGRWAYFAYTLFPIGVRVLRARHQFEASATS
jgi:uncharacterized membrane protein